MARFFLRLNLLVALLAIAGCGGGPAQSTIAVTPFPNLAATSTNEPIALGSSLLQFERSMVLEKGSSGEWDSAWVAEPYVVQHEGHWYMYYNGSNVSRRGVGLATSDDGLVWSKYGTEPVYLHRGLEPTAWATPLFNGDHWVMYYTVGPAGKFREFYRATAPAPEGPWEHDPEFELTAPRGSWNQRLMPMGLTEYEGTYLLNYIGFDNTHTVLSPGLFTSTDGTNWEALPEPLAEAGLLGEWTINGLIPSNILVTENGLELFFIGIDRDWRDGPSDQLRSLPIGRMTSPDGINWTIAEEEAQLIDNQETVWYGMNVVTVGDEYRIYLAHDKFDGIVLLRGRLNQ